MTSTTATVEKAHVPFVDLAAQYAAVADEIETVVSRVLRGTEYILGQEVDLFEQEFAAYCDAGHAVGVDSGTSALEFALRAYGIGTGDEVVTAAHSFVASAFAVSDAGATPILVDVDPRTSTIAVERIEAAITARTKAIIPVHLYGHPADMDPILEIARRHGLVVIEDACQAHGARYKGRRVGGLGHAAAFSFYPAKNLGAYGDGGTLVTNDARVADAARMLRNYGQREKYHHVLRGYNRRLDTLQAAVLRVKLNRLDGWNAARSEHAERYQALLAGSSVGLPVPSPDVEPVWHLYVIRARDRAALKTWLADRDISAGIHYPVPIHLQPAYRDLGYKPGDFPAAERVCDEALSLPMYAELTPRLVEYVASAVREFDGERHSEGLIGDVAD